MTHQKASYLHLLEQGELAQRAEQAQAGLSDCTGCAWECHVDRLAGKYGQCATGEKARVASYGPHMGEEDPLRGWRGSGTIFFARCNLHCVFCQNYDISAGDAGVEVAPDQLAAIMLEIQSQGCHNINLVSPSHIVPQIIAAVNIAAHRGLQIPIVYNTGGYDSLASLQLLDGIVDIYMPDMKYSDEATARRFSGIPAYPEINQAAVKEMHRQVGDLILDENGVAVRGLLVRHLVLPNNLAGTAGIARFLYKDFSAQTYLNIMDQYRPEYRAGMYADLRRPCTRTELREAVKTAIEAGLTRLDQRRDDG
jgi:putative pyruvate formate lyase activating enzyme